MTTALFSVGKYFVNKTCADLYLMTSAHQKATTYLAVGRCHGKPTSPQVATAVFTNSTAPGYIVITTLLDNVSNCEM